MKKWFKPIATAGIVFFLFGCGHMAYLGMHGNSIRLYPDIHESVSEDVQCLECHHPDNSQGPPTPHPGFTGCINCHNDSIE